MRKFIKVFAAFLFVVYGAMPIHNVFRFYVSSAAYLGCCDPKTHIEYRVGAVSNNLSGLNDLSVLDVHTVPSECDANFLSYAVVHKADWYPWTVEGDGSSERQVLEDLINKMYQQKMLFMADSFASIPCVAAEEIPAEKCSECASSLLQSKGGEACVIKASCGHMYHEFCFKRILNTGKRSVNIGTEDVQRLLFKLFNTASAKLCTTCGDILIPVR